MARMGYRTGTYRAQIGRPEEKRPFGTPRRSWKDNIKKDIQEVRWRGVDWIHLARDRDRWWALVNTVMNLQVA